MRSTHRRVALARLSPGAKRDHALCTPLSHALQACEESRRRFPHAPVPVDACCPGACRPGIRRGNPGAAACGGCPAGGGRGAYAAPDPRGLRAAGRRVHRRCGRAVPLLRRAYQRAVPATRALRRLCQGTAECRQGREAQRCDPRAQCRVPGAAGGGAGVAPAVEQQGRAGWTGPVAHLPGRGEEAGCRRQDSAGDDVRRAAADGRQGLQLRPSGDANPRRAWRGVVPAAGRQPGFTRPM
ncbi:hypothetical protein G6F65_014643 [Rhizopus arrhizus]|nr:hypothetical protein G6F65_014643 [Rhizopus arrhizus]